MTSSRRALILPAEEQVREFDAKLLLACAAAERGFPSVVGSRREIHLRATGLPKGVYFAKSFRAMSLRMFRVLRDLGFEIFACDEEALVRYSDELYYERRASPEAFRMITQLFAWGADNVGLFERCPHYSGAPIHATGNPRVDLMRPELRGYFDADVHAIRDRFGDFILINTNFGTVNHRIERLGWLSAAEAAADGAAFHDFKIATAKHRLAVFRAFQEALPVLSRAFPERSIVVRPHPLENQQKWERAAAGHENLHVVHEGNVVPWLLAASAVVQNNCTTGIEAHLLGRPVVSYRPVVSEQADSPFIAALTHEAGGVAELCDRLREICSGKLGLAERPGQRELLEQRIAALQGRLASDRIVDALEASEASGERTPPPGALRFARGCAETWVRVGEKRVRSWIPGDKNSRSYQVQRFPGLATDDVRERVARFGRLLGRFEKLRVERISRDVFRIEAD